MDWATFWWLALAAGTGYCLARAGIEVLGWTLALLLTWVGRDWK